MVWGDVGCSAGCRYLYRELVMLMHQEVSLPLEFGGVENYYIFNFQ